MQKILILFCALALAGARPDVRFGYRYADPSFFNYVPGSYLPPTPTPYTLTRIIGNSFGRAPMTSFAGPTVAASRPSLVNIGPGSVFSASRAPPYRQPYQPPRVSDTIFGSIDPGFVSSTIAPPIFEGNVPAFGPTEAPTSDLFALGGSSASSIPVEISNPGVGGISHIGSTAFEQQYQEPTISKHFYLHSAPEEPEDIVHKHLVIGKPERAYRVVFIKAPASNSQARISASYAPKDEKTVIYVLSKKPQDVEINEIVTPPPTEPSKPEVVFVKYKTPEEAVHAQQTIQAQYDQLGGSSHVSDEGFAPLTSVIGALGNTDPQDHREILSDQLVTIVPTFSPVNGIRPINQQHAYLASKH